MKARPASYKRKLDLMLAEVRRDTTIQVASVILWALAIFEDFDEERLRKLMRSVTGLSEDMDGVSFVPPFTSDDCTRYLKENYGIDLDAEIKLEVY